MTPSRLQEIKEYVASFEAECNCDMKPCLFAGCERELLEYINELGARIEELEHYKVFFESLFEFYGKAPRESAPIKCEYCGVSATLYNELMHIFCCDSCKHLVLSA
jgi:ferritin-like protein